MRRFVSLAEQVAEARSLITRDDVVHLRMALLLLDNVSELVLFHRIEGTLERDNFAKRLSMIVKRELGDAARLEWESSSSGRRPMTAKQRRSLEHDYSEKVAFVVRQGDIPYALGRALRCLHRYRNEAYHRHSIRHATLRPATLFYYELVCNLFESIGPRPRQFSPEDDWTDFCRRYGLTIPVCSNQDPLGKVVTVLRSDIGLSLEALAAALSNHLLSRLEDMEQDLTFVSSLTLGESEADTVLKGIQYFAEYDTLPASPFSDTHFVQYKPAYTVRGFRGWRSTVLSISTCDDRVEAFARFAEVEECMEPIERTIHEEAERFRRQIELEVAEEIELRSMRDQNRRDT